MNYELVSLFDIPLLGKTWKLNKNFTGKHLCWSLFLIKLQACKRLLLTISKKINKFFCIQPSSCNSNSYNSKNHLNRRNSVVPSEFTSKFFYESSYNSNSHNSKNHLNRTDYLVPWTIFCHVLNFDLKNSFSLLVSDREDIFECF